LRKETINEPTIEWALGERVQHGAWDESIVVETIDYGKILKLEEWNMTKPGSQNAGTKHHRFMHVAWHDVERYRTSEEDKDIEIFAEADDLFLQYGQRDMLGLLGTYYHFGINMEPDYQRGNVWDLEDKVKLIDSIFRRIDIGKFVFINNRITNNGPLYEILDGKQRITALVEFKERRFVYKGKYYDDLSFEDRHLFDYYPISWGDLRIGSGGRDLTNEQRYRCFLRLNTGGRLQDLKHIEYVEQLWQKVKK